MVARSLLSPVGLRRALLHMELCVPTGAFVPGVFPRAPLPGHGLDTHSAPAEATTHTRAVSKTPV